MPSPEKLTLAEAKRQGKLDRFAKNHDADPPGDEEAFNRLFGAMAGTSREAPEACPPSEGDD